MTDADTLRAEIRTLVVGRRRGDIPERGFERRLTEKMLDLCRAVVRPVLAPDEPVHLEHHVVHAHLRLSQSVLKEPEQHAVSLFLTPRRLLRLRTVISPGRPATCDERDGTVIDALPLERMANLRVHRQVRWGEMAAGAVIAALGWLARPWLAATGPILVAVGVVGLVHGLLLPTRWCDVETRDATIEEPMRIFALGRRSGRALVRALRARLVAAVE